MKTGACKYCGQTRAFDVREAVSDAELDEMATEECTCSEARYQRERREKLERAEAWARETFTGTDNLLQTILCAVKATFEGSADRVTIKAGKNTYKIDTDADDLIRFKNTYKESSDTTF